MSKQECGLGNAGEKGIPNNEEWPTFSTPFFLDAHALTYKDGEHTFSTPFFLDAHALTYKDGEHVVHESHCLPDAGFGRLLSSTS